MTARSVDDRVCATIRKARLVAEMLRQFSFSEDTGYDFTPDDFEAIADLLEDMAADLSPITDAPGDVGNWTPEHGDELPSVRARRELAAAGLPLPDPVLADGQR